MVNGPSWDMEVRLYWVYGALVALVFVAERCPLAYRAAEGFCRYQLSIGTARSYSKRLFRFRCKPPSADPACLNLWGPRSTVPPAGCAFFVGRRDCLNRAPQNWPLSLDLEPARNVRLACQLRPRSDVSVLLLLPPNVTAYDRRRLSADARGSEQFAVIMFVDIRHSTSIVEKTTFDVVFVLNHFFEAVAGAVIEEQGSPNQFLGDGMMAVFGIDAQPRDACRHAFRAVRRVIERLDEFDARLADELVRTDQYWHWP